METTAILIPVTLSFLILLAPTGLRFSIALLVSVLTILLTTLPAISCLADPACTPLIVQTSGGLGSITFTVDSLSGFFILVTNFAMLLGLIYSKGYLRPYLTKRSPARIALHYFSYIWLHLSMLGVLTLREGLSFLISWELMAVSSFMLILFDAENRTTLKIAVSYLIQMHVGLVLLIVAFLIVDTNTGIFGFDGLKPYFSDHPNIPLFVIFLLGFGIKAGFIPLHTWLPEAHPAAPSHVSGVMSGVMVKMGIFGILRVLTSVQADWYIIGLIMLIISVLTALFGIFMALSQHDLKKVLAYSTIENIGIIGTGIGVASMGMGLQNQWMIFAGFTGGLLHVMNHSFFKPILFFSAGSVYTMYHTRDIEKLGGVIHRMPQTSALFLTGSLAISGLPPLNGFISEILVYMGMFKGIQAGSVHQSIIMMAALIFMVITGGLALFCFTRAFGICFLGTPRSVIRHPAGEVTGSMLIPQYILAVMILLTGLLPMIMAGPLIRLTSNVFGISAGIIPDMMMPVLTNISLVGFVLIFMVAGLALVRHYVIRNRPVEHGPTWGCGYTAATPKQQYTAHSFAANFAELADPVLRSRYEFPEIGEEEIFPASPRSFTARMTDTFDASIRKITGASIMTLKWIARLQTGNIRHYILYAFIFILLIFLLLYLRLI